MLGVGDDCALLRPDAGLDLAVTTDMLVEGRHFLPGAEPRALEITVDDFEFVQAMLRERATSSGRCACAIFSSTPLTKR